MIVEVRDAAVRLLTAFADPELAPLLPEMTMQLAPRPGDVDLVFAPSVAEQVEVAYQRVWEKGIVMGPNHGQTQVIVAACAAGMLADEKDPAAAKFPGGYRRIAHLLRPEVIWFAWKFVEPGRTSGMAYNGLVRIDNRFVWFPKPWVALGANQPDELREN
jgi:hypothetical protein